MAGKIRQLFTKYERYISPTALLVGFVIDNLTLTRIDLLFDNLILLSYLIIIGICILVVTRYNLDGLPDKRARIVTRWALIIMQFAFGGIFSGYFVFYSRSASISASWIFLLILLLLLIGNEFFQRHYLRLVFKLTLYYLAIFSYVIFSLPVITGKMGAWMFVLSGVVSLIIMYGFTRLIYKINKTKWNLSKNYVKSSVISVFILFNILYFTNIIPPIPLSLKEAGVYHNVTRTQEGYVVEEEKLPWYQFWNRNQFHYKKGERVYSYSAVFAPTKLSGTVIHRWSYHTDDGWIVTDEIPFTISGGRDGGYRGYTFKSSVTPGQWRVDVVTKRGQLIGRKSFEVVETSEPVNKSEKLL